MLSLFFFRAVAARLLYVGGARRALFRDFGRQNKHGGGRTRPNLTPLTAFKGLGAYLQIREATHLDGSRVALGHTYLTRNSFDGALPCSRIHLVAIFSVSPPLSVRT